MITNFASFHFIGSGEIVELDLGFIPDFVYLQVEGAATACVWYIWERIMEDEGVAAIKGGIRFSEGVTAIYAHDGLIAAFEGKIKTPTIVDWTTAVSTAATAKTGLVHGTYVRPTGLNGNDRSAIFECVVAGTGIATEPDWATLAPALGNQFVEPGGDTTWERVNVAEEIKQCNGIEIAAAIAVDSTIFSGYAIRGDVVKNFGDAANWPVGETASSRILSLP